MATPKGVPSGRSSSALMQRMASDPIQQLNMREASLQEGRDNRAVSMQSRHLGAAVGQEQSRLMGLDKVGTQLATRRDELAYRKQISDFEQDKFAEQQKRRAAGLNLDRQKLELADRRIEESFNRAEDIRRNAEERAGAMSDYSGLELGLGLLSTGIEGYRSYKSAKDSKVQKAIWNEMVASYTSDKKRRSVTDTTANDTFEREDFFARR